MRLSLEGDAWELREAGSGEPVPAIVPRVVHMDLLRAGRMPDPFYRDHEKAVQWVGQRDWTYRRSFDLPEAFLQQDSLELVCEGLDTVAELFLNGKRVGSAENMFHAHRFDLRRAANAGPNELEIRFASAERIAAERQKEFGLLPGVEDDSRVWLRKAQCHFGWDWGPRIITCGIWRPIYVEAASVARLEDVVARCLYADTDVAVLQIELKLEHLAMQHGAPLKAEGLEALVRLTHVESAYETESRLPIGTAGTIKIEVQRPHLWWPAGYGDPALYELSVRLAQGNTQSQVLDERRQKIGLRTVKLVQAFDDPGRKPVKDNQGRTGVPQSFVLSINGKKVFCRGANWIPADALLPRVTPEKYAALVGRAADAGMNMLRVWGGGIYEDEAFYDACDRRGLLVWQDFMFACAYYPEDPARHGWFLEQVRHEARHAVRRLRNHACVALWCGNNENHQAHHDGWFRLKRKTAEGGWGRSIYHEVLPEIVGQLDPSRPYWPGSPWSPSGENPLYALDGDYHRWDVWSHFAPAEAYRDDQARFMSEFGFQAMPTAATIREFTEAGDRRLASPVMVRHNKQSEGTERLRHYAAQSFVLPPEEDLDAWSYLTQVVQARSVQVGVDHWRQRKFGPPRAEIPEGYDCAGALFWQLNDCWPVASWSAIDGAGRPKALWYYARRFFAPVRAVLVPRTRGAFAPIELWASILNDTRDKIAGIVTLSLYTLTGQPLYQHQQSVDVEANGILHLDRALTARGQATNPTPTFWMLQFENANVYSETHYFPVADKLLELPQVTLHPEVHAPSSGEDPYDGYLLIRAEAAVRDLCVELPDTLVDRVALFDNFITLAPGKSAMIPLKAGGVPLEEIRGAVRLRTTAPYSGGHDGV